MAYGTKEGFEDWLEAMGYSLPVDAPPATALLARGSAYLDAVYEPLWTGQRTGGVMQEQGWPRVGAKYQCSTAIPSDVIPPAIVKAAYRAAFLEGSEQGTLSASMVSGKRVASEKAGEVAVSYFNESSNQSAGSGAVAYVDSEIDGLMRSFICEVDGSGVWLRVVG